MAFTLLEGYRDRLKEVREGRFLVYKSKDSRRLLLAIIDYNSSKLFISIKEGTNRICYIYKYYNYYRNLYREWLYFKEINLLLILLTIIKKLKREGNIALSFNKNISFLKLYILSIKYYLILIRLGSYIFNKSSIHLKSIEKKKLKINFGSSIIIYKVDLIFLNIILIKENFILYKYWFKLSLNIRKKVKDKEVDNFNKGGISSNIEELIEEGKDRTRKFKRYYIFNNYYIITYKKINKEV
ncbi:hypothetical protein B0T21DRAFT_344921 [Apiosordaria backusii]|uniref:Uncharacterized protein n=1 Tax=Apiosordaria backusii TaxID=314023 RepID=A0AA40ESM4_9PEZI|nr:hypothetical protein B0T21DRAFT_344921 [Apiosordaria backusii]